MARADHEGSVGKVLCVGSDYGRGDGSWDLLTQDAVTRLALKEAVEIVVRIHDIIFDLGNVLIPVDWNKAFGRLKPHLSAELARLLEQDLESFKRLLVKPGIELETGKIDFRQFRDAVTDILGVTFPPDEFRIIWCDIFQLDVEMSCLGRNLSLRYGTWLASNTSREHYSWILEKFPEVEFYRDAALSFEMGVMKPAVEYYEKAVRKFGISAQSAVFIDDLAENVDGAIRSGMHGIVFNGRKQLVADLLKIGVEASDSLEE